MTTIAFIGLGNMGNPMAANLVKAGHPVQGFDLVPENLANGSRAWRHGHGQCRRGGEGRGGGHHHAAGRQACRFGLRGHRTEPTRTARCSSTARPSTSTSARKAHGDAARHGLLSVDAPVSGGTGGATAGTLTFMAGGAKEAFASGPANPRSRWAGSIVHCGDAGAGQAARSATT